MAKVFDAIRASSALAAQDINFYASIDKDLCSRFDLSAKSLLNLANKLLRQCNGPEFTALDHQDFQNSSNSWKKVENVLDSAFESVDYLMDSMKSDSKQDKRLITLELDGTPDIKFDHVEKPQKSFKYLLDNFDSSPFKPKLQCKPNAMVSLQESFHSNKLPPTHFANPYTREILESIYPELITRNKEVISPRDWATTLATWVDTVPALELMIEALEQLTEIAVDLEHHDYRSYYGFTCLMQISKRDSDWLVDTIALRDDLIALNKIFTNPNIIKVFHGANMDIIWLQRDLGLYVVSLFDTYHASKALGFPKFSLAYLLETFANFQTSKKYQLADWRIRPLPQILFDYARADTHFLLSIFDILRNQLVAAGKEKLDHVLYQSRLVACNRFEYKKHRISADEWSSFDDRDLEARILAQNNIPEFQRPLARTLLELRDDLARKYDESTRYVMPTRTFVNLCSLQTPVTLESLKSGLGKSYNLLKDDIETIRMILNTPTTLERPDSEINIDALISTARHCAELYLQLLKVSATSESSRSLLSDTSKVLPLDNISHPVATSMVNIVLEDFATHPDAIAAPSQRPVKSRKRTKDDQVEETTDDKRHNTARSDDLIRPLRKKTRTINASKELAKQDDAVFDYSKTSKNFLRSELETTTKKKSYHPFQKTDGFGPKMAKVRKTFQSGKSTSFSK